MSSVQLNKQSTVKRSPTVWESLPAINVTKNNIQNIQKTQNTMNKKKINDPLQNKLGTWTEFLKEVKKISKDSPSYYRRQLLTDVCCCYSHNSQKLEIVNFHQQMKYIFIDRLMNDESIVHLHGWIVFSC